MHNEDEEDIFVPLDEVDGESDGLPQKNSPAAALQQALEEAQAEARKNLDGWQRSQADFENYKRRKENENQELVIFAREVVVAKMLPTLDSLEQAIKHMPQSEGLSAEELNKKYEQWGSGMQGLVVQLDKVLEELGVKKIEALGKQFDPNFHEAIQEVPGEEDGTVMQEFVTGYELNGKVIRPSQVAISKKQ